MIVYRFMCNSSCVGNLTRRPVNAVFTLESAAGAVLGRCVIGLRICACPGRDRDTEEMTLSKTVRNKAVKRSHCTTDVNESSSSKQPRTEDNKIFTLKVISWCLSSSLNMFKSVLFCINFSRNLSPQSLEGITLVDCYYNSSMSSKLQL